MNSFKRISVLFALCSLAFLTYTCSDTTTGTDSGNENTNIDSKTAPGSSAELFLKDDQYASLQVEIDYMPNQEPTQEGLNSLKTFLENRLHKGNISFRSPTEIDSRGQSSYTADNIRSIEKKERDFFTESNGNTLNVYFVVLDGEFNDGKGGGSNVLGVAYWNTSVAFFGPRIEEISGSPPTAPSEEKVEGTVFRHEFGHNMGLVGNGTPTQSNHKTSGSAHCTKDGCLMEPTIQTGNFFENFSGTVPSLKDACLADLQANGGK